MRTSFSCLGLLAGMLLVSSNQAYALNYTFVALGDYVSHASAINNAGQIAGSSNWQAVLWDGVTETRLDMLGGAHSSSVEAINDAGQMAGYSGNHATLWNGTIAADLGTLGGTYSIATAINDSGQVAGNSTIAGGSVRATLWNGGTATDLGTLGGNFSAAHGINNTGQVVGESSIASGSYRATLWNGGTVTDLGTLGGDFSAAYAINNTGQVAGYSMAASGSYHATLWNGAMAIDIDPDGVDSAAYAINNSGQVVGMAHNGNNSGGWSDAMLWNSTTAINLNSFLDASTVNAGWILYTATGINDQGWITGNAFNGLTGEDRAYLLTPPVPEPEAYAMLLAGLGLVGFKSRRRRIA